MKRDVDFGELDRQLEQFEHDVCRYVVDAVGAVWDPPPHRRWLQLVVLPSFEHEVVVTVTEADEGAVVSARTAQCSVWLFMSHSNRDSWSSRDESPSPAPSPVVAEAALSVADLERMWSIAGMVVPPPPVLGLDGITFRLRTRVDTAVDDVDEVKVWSPRRHAPIVQLFDMLVARLAGPG